HELEGENPVAEWTKGSALKPLLDALEEPQLSAFENDYRRRVAAAYPPPPPAARCFPSAGSSSSRSAVMLSTVSAPQHPQPNPLAPRRGEQGRSRSPWSS